MEKRKFSVSHLLSIVVPIAVFVVLFLIGTLYDLQISQALVSGLASGKYYTTNVIAEGVEIIGSVPFYSLAFFACLVIYRKFTDMKGKVARFKYLFMAGQFVCGTMLIYDIFKYIFRYKENTWMTTQIGMLVGYVSFGLLAMVIGSHYYKRVSSKTNNVLLKFAFVIVACCACYLIVAGLKTINGRIRYRAMNEIGDFSYYMPWYYFNKETGLDEALFAGGSDAFNSFPSGHTFVASLPFVFTCLPDLFESCNKKSTRVIINVVCVCWVVFVGLFRIIAGAHFLTDVTFSGFLGYLIVRVSRYVFITRKKNA